MVTLPSLLLLVNPLQMVGKKFGVWNTNIIIDIDSVPLHALIMSSDADSIVIPESLTFVEVLSLE